MTSDIQRVNDRQSNMPNANNGESSDEIRENIEQKRRSMGDKIDQIQERFDPKYLRDQTQEVVRNVMADGTDAMMDYVRENSRELGHSLTSALKRHPLPAALIGLGLVWLLVDNVSGSSESSDRSRRSNYGPDPRFYNYERAAYDSGQRSQYGRGYDSGSYSDQYGRNYGQSYGQSYGQPYGSQSGWYGGSQGSSQGNWQGSENEPSLKDKAMDAKDKAMDAVSGAAENVRETVKEWGQDMGQKVGQKASEFGGEVREWAGDFGHDAQWKAQQFGRDAGYRARQISSDNPLMTGAVAFAIGAAAGLLLPPTRMENEWMGEARERFMSSAKETADQVVQRAEEIVQEVKPDVEQTVKDIGESVKRTGQEAADRLKETAQTTRSKVEQEVKTEMGKLEGQTEKTGNMPQPKPAADKAAGGTTNRPTSTS